MALTGKRGQTGLVSVVVGIAVAVLVVTILLPIVIYAIGNASFTGTTATIMNNVPIFLALLVLIAIASYFGLKG